MNFETLLKEKCKETKQVTFAVCLEIHEASKTLTLEECLAVCLLNKEELDADELNLAEKVYNRGRAIGIKDAGEKLFAHMSTRNGGQSALEYLAHVTETFSGEVTVSAGAGKGFSFNVTIPKSE